MKRKRFNWLGLLAAIVLAAGSSLIVSIADNELSKIEFVRAIIQAIIAFPIFYTNSKTKRSKRSAPQRS